MACTAKPRVKRGAKYYMSNLVIQETNAGVVFKAKIVPGSSRTAFAGVLDGALKIKVAAPAEKGRANKALIDFLAGQISVKRNDISIISGQTKATKTIKVSGVTAKVFLDRLGLSK